MTAQSVKFCYTCLLNLEVDNMQENVMIVGQVAKKKFLIALLSGFLAFGGIAAFFGLTTTAFALPLGGMGDFYVVIDELEGTGFQLQPQIGETGNADAAPMVRNLIDDVNIKGLTIYKDLKMPTGNWIRVNIEAPSASIQGLTQDARFIDANLSFTNMDIKEKNTDNFEENWTHSADTVTITDAKIVTDYLFQNFVALNGAKISIDKIDGPELIE